MLASKVVIPYYFIIACVIVYLYFDDVLTGRQNLSKDTEEDQFASILTLMEILTNLLSKDFIDFATGKQVRAVVSRWEN